MDAEEFQKNIKQMQDENKIGSEYATIKPSEVHVVIIPRTRWQAGPPGEGLKPNKLPATQVCYTYLTGLAPAEWADMDTTMRTLRRMQRYFKSQGLPDIPYNFLINSDTRIYECRGWEFKPELDTEHINIDIAMVKMPGLESNKMQLLELIERSLQLVHYGVHRDYIDRGYYTMKRLVDVPSIF